MMLLPLLAGVIWGMVFWYGGFGMLRAALASAVLAGTFISLLTEAQSIVGLMTQGASAAGWAGFLIVGLLVMQGQRKTHPEVSLPSVTVTPELVIVGVFLMLTLVTALAAAPNSYDGLTYHLTRVERWIQQGSLAPFATHDTRQLFMPSVPEYAILQWRLLSDGDRFANLVQWGAYVGAIGGAALLAGALSERPRAPLIAAALTATIPMAIAQASGTQTDLVAACWTALACAFGYRLLRPDASALDAVLSAVSLGLAVATKQTAALFSGVALVPVAVLLLQRGMVRRLVQWAGVGVMAVLVLAGPQLARNRQVFGDWRGDPAIVDEASSTVHGVVPTTVTLLRNLTLHAGTPFDGLNLKLGLAVVQTSHDLGIDASDPRITWSPRYSTTPWNTHEEAAPNPLQLLLIVCCAIVGLAARRRSPAIAFGAAVVIAVLLFCSLVKWQEYNSRLHLPAFVLALAVCAGVLAAASPWARIAVLGVLAVAALPQALVNYTRPLLTLTNSQVSPRGSVLATSRAESYFAYWPPFLVRPYIDVALKIAESGCRDIGLRDHPDAWEYPLMALVREAGAEVQFRSVDVENASARFGTPGPAPCLLVQIRPSAAAPPVWAADWRVLAGFSAAPRGRGLALFAPPNAGARAPAAPQAERPSR